MTLTHMRCPYCHGKSIEAQRTYTIQCGEPRTMYHCSPPTPFNVVNPGPCIIVPPVHGLFQKPAIPPLPS